MSCTCTDVCEAVMGRLIAMGFTELDNDDDDHADVLAALAQVRFVKEDESSAVIDSNDDLITGKRLKIGYYAKGEREWTEIEIGVDSMVEVLLPNGTTLFNLQSTEENTLKLFKESGGGIVIMPMSNRKLEIS